MPSAPALPASDLSFLYRLRAQPPILHLSLPCLAAPQMRFDQDNTISDRPMVDVLTSLDHMLAGAAARAGSAGSGASLHQLVLVVADGRWVGGRGGIRGWWVGGPRMDGRVTEGRRAWSIPGSWPADACSWLATH